MALFNTLSNDLDNVNESLNTVNDMSSIAIPFEIVGGSDRNFIVYDTGGISANQAYRATKYIDISKYNTIAYKRTGTDAESTKAGMAFFNAEKVYISGIMSLVQQESKGYSEQLYLTNVPDNATYARFTTFTDTGTYGEFELYGYTKLAEGVRNGIKLRSDNAYKLSNIYPNKLISDADGNASDNSQWWSTGYIKIDKGAIGYFCDAEARIAEYTDASYTTFLNYTTNTYSNVFVPQLEANYLRISFPTGSSPAFVPLYDRKTYSIGNVLSRLDNGKADLDAQVESINESLVSLNNIADMTLITIPFDLITTEYTFLRYDTGTAASNLTYRATKYIDISRYHALTYKRTGTTAESTKAGMAFYNAEKVYISGIMSLVQQESNGYSGALYSVNVPDNATYARFTTFADTNTYGNFELYGYTKLAEGVKNGIKLNADNAYDLNNIYTNKLINEKTGNASDNSQWWSTGYIKIDKGAIGYFCDAEARIAEYTDASYTTFLNYTTNTYSNVFVPQLEANYLRISFPTGSSPAFVPLYDRKTYSIGNVLSRLDNGRSSFGRENVLAMLRHMQEIKWVPTAPVPIIQSANNYNTIAAGTEIIGLPYSSVRSVCKYIGLNVSLYTFMSAVQNPRSVLYKRIITTGHLGATYYGVVCGSYPAYALGFKDRFVNPFIISQYCTEISQYEIQPGDLIIDTGDRETDSSNKHMLIITAVYYDNYGRINKVGISEARPPLVRSLTWNYSTLLTSYGPSTQYKFYRYNDIDKCGYSSTPLVKGYQDEVETEISYPDIMSEFGDMACIEAGLNVTINIINARNYSTIKIYKDNVLIDTKTNVSDFVISNIEYGLYRFDIVEENGNSNQVVNSSSSYLMVADVNGTYDPNTGRVTFSSVNATPIAMQSYATEETSPRHGGVQNLEHLFTSEEIAAGEANASSIVGVQYPCVQICFATEYGTAMWYSTPLNDQWDYWNPES